MFLAKVSMNRRKPKRDGQEERRRISEIERADTPTTIKPTAAKNISNIDCGVEKAQKRSKGKVPAPFGAG